MSVSDPDNVPSCSGKIDSKEFVKTTRVFPNLVVEHAIALCNDWLVFRRGSTPVASPKMNAIQDAKSEISSERAIWHASHAAVVYVWINDQFEIDNNVLKDSVKRTSLSSTLSLGYGSSEASDKLGEHLAIVEEQRAIRGIIFAALPRHVWIL
ncbi:hypothetical protein SISNIDRAFT_465599 [Sistotremastrum niveocremeum HHB9708]|uniref:Uncharacterized protein n=1 Tax=Sistotremastrum niveocremeum HHB9708 TaxID=1314777 RepID=A0A164VCN2_9AGAM|nr:hypothetical protein SISNIDRAFT_465599 [Sistotremastrum niveocremeum HHB9708]